ncbi:MAG: hypothetical protein IMZ66_08255 [Planctomycetes bacterium]|nr:hypothetical protein [Planctomycetota bacterium]
MRTRIAVVLLALLAASCQPAPEPQPPEAPPPQSPPSPSAKSDFPAAQALVDAAVAAHTDLVRLTIHAVPAGETQSRIIACNLAEKIGKPSAPEDLDAMKTGTMIVLKEGANLDVTAPIFDKRGRAIAAAGITLRIPGGATEEEMVEEAKTIAAALTTAIENAAAPLW